jgi:hypothetical protein
VSPTSNSSRKGRAVHDPYQPPLALRPRTRSVVIGQVPGSVLRLIGCPLSLRPNRVVITICPVLCPSPEPGDNGPVEVVPLDWDGTREPMRF